MLRMTVNDKPPNYYFRWIILLCSVTNHVIVVGMPLSLGVMYVHWLDDFQTGKGVTSWTLSLESSLLLAFSPVSASLASRLGFRTVAFVGALVTFFGVIASSFAESIVHIIIFQGLVTGIGGNLCYLPSVAMVALHFDKRRSLAMGIATTGSGVGAFILAPLLNYLIDTFTWRGALLVLSGICLNLCATALCFRPAISKRVEENEQEMTVESEQMDNLLPSAHLQMVDNDITDGKTFSSSESTFETSKSLMLPIFIKNRLLGNDVQHIHASLDELGPKRKPSPHNSFPNLNESQKKRKSHESLIKSLRHIDTALLASASGFHLLKDDTEANEKQTFCQLTELKQQKQDAEEPKARKRSWFSRFLALTSLKANLEMLRDKAFFLFCMSNFLTCLSYFTPVVYLVDRAVHEGIDNATGASFVSACGCGSILGRIITGLVADCSCCSNRMLMYSISLCTEGVGTILSCLCGDIAILHGIYAFYLGFHMGIYSVLSPLVTIDLQGRPNVAMAYGIVLFFMGMACLIGPPISGWLFDWSRSYTLSYATSGLFLVLGGVLVFPLLFRRHRTEIVDDK